MAKKLDNPRESLATRLSRVLLPSSIEWLIGRGYLRRVSEDGVSGLKITEAGVRYFGVKGESDE
jgi:hypothetical protein